MAVSHINMECKRYGCMKNLLACYANCRYNGRCDELRTEVIAKADQATKDINDYLGERGRAPIAIQVMKRGLRFTEAPRQQATQKSAEVKKLSPPPPQPVAAEKSGDAKTVSPKAVSLTARRARRKKRKLTSAPAHTVKTITSKQVSDFTKRDSKQSTKQRKRMARKSTREESSKKQERAESSAAPVEGRDSTAAAKAAASRNGSARKRREPARNTHPAKKNGKIFIILDGKTANLVDEQGLIAHLLANNSPGARYFEASEVEARLQIVPKR